MALFALYADKEHLKRADRRHTVIVDAADAASAPAAARALFRIDSSYPDFDDWSVVELTAANVGAGVVVDGMPQGRPDQNVWPTLRHGDPL